MDWIRSFFGALVLAVVIAFSGLTLATPAFAQQIVVEGNTGVTPASLKPYFSGMDPASIQRGVDDLKATGIYSSVSARAEDGRIVVSLASGKQIINRVAFEGNSKITKEQLEVEVQSKPGVAYNDALGEADVARIKDAYRKYGYNEAQVTKRLVQLPNGRVDLVFTIDEHGKTGIREIRFVGNNAVSSYRLHNLMQTSTMNFLSWFKSTDVYDPDRLASDEEAIRRYYMKNGYADFRIVNTDVAYQANPPGYVITITLDEGPQYHVSGVSVDSHIPAVNGPSLLRFSSSARGRRLRRRRGRQDGRRHEPRRRKPRLRLLGSAPARRPRHGEPHDRAELLGRRRSESLHRADRHRRQHKDARLRHSPRVRHRRRRPLQPRDDRAGRAPAEQPRLLQEGPYFEPSGLVARPRHRGGRGRGPADRLDQPQRRLFDDARRHGRTRLHRDQLSRPRPVRPPERVRRSVQPGLEGVVHRALLPGSAPGGGVRRLSPGPVAEPVRALPELDDRRHAAARHPDHGRPDVPAELRALPVEDHDPEHHVAAL